LNPTSSRVPTGVFCLLLNYYSTYALVPWLGKMAKSLFIFLFFFFFFSFLYYTGMSVIITFFSYTTISLGSTYWELVYITLLVESAINQNIEYTTAQPDNTALNIKHGRPCDFSLPFGWHIHDFWGRVCYIGCFPYVSNKETLNSTSTNDTVTSTELFPSTVILYSTNVPADPSLLSD